MQRNIRLQLGVIALAATLAACSDVIDPSTQVVTD